MDKDTAIKIAKSKKSTPVQLKELLGLSDEIDLLLAKHPNTTAEMLDYICERQSFDPKICGAALAHPNISADQLLNVGWEYPSAMFRNPSLPAIMSSQKNFLGKFDGEEFENSLKKEVPEFVVDWLALQGEVEYQAIYLFSKVRTPDVMAKFRRSKHAKIVAQLLQRDDETYLAWAQDLGFEMPPPVEDEPVIVRSEIDHWVERLDNENRELWKKLVPAEGVANSVQGELVRAIGRLQSENFRNGMMNWGDGSGHYEVFTDFVHATLKSEPSFTKLVKKVIDADVDEIKQAGKRGAAVASGRKSRESAFGHNFLIASDVEKSMQRLGALVGIWCQRHPDLVPYSG